MRLQATGAFTPGTAITLTSEVHGLRGTALSKLAIYAQHAASVAGRASRETTQEISVAAGSDKSHSTVVTFAEPGYYPVSASVSTIAPQELDQDRALGVPVSSVITSNRWILIDEKGGRIDEEYDHSILEGTTRYLTNGSVGAFRSKPNARASSVSMVTARSAGASLLSPTDFNGRITYQRRLIGQSNTTEGVAGARVYGYCASVDDDPVGYFDIAADAQGAFSVDCNTPEAYRISVQGALTGSGVQVNGINNDFAGVNGSIYASSLGAQVDLAVINDDAAQVFLNHLRYNVPRAPCSVGRVDRSPTA